ncbi:MAG: class II fumarate hydratase [Chlamydiales bacterium]|nr:class II fumarate hydratase [Chlamydiales bacterium]
MAKKTRVEKDSLGEVVVPLDVYWGAQTARSLLNFCIGSDTMPRELILAIVLLKKSAALTNHKLKLLDKKKMQAIVSACDEILNGKFADQFPLVIWQTGSGTQTNMNVNEVISTRANELLGHKNSTKFPIHPNDDVNMSQSSNDVFPSAIHIAACFEIEQKLINALTTLQKALDAKAKSFKKIIKVGRTHLMDATVLTLGQEFSGYVYQVASGIAALKASLNELHSLAIGATAVGTGINAPKDFGKAICKTLSSLSKSTFIPQENPFAALSTSDACVTTSSAIKRLGCTLFKIANDIRWMGSGPRCGLGELILPENEPGSSIMPGKVNPTQSEALMMVSTQIIGLDAAITMAASQGNFELNVMRPLIAYNLLQEIRLLTDAAASFTKNCILGLKANTRKIKAHLDSSLMHATALNPHIGYDKAAAIVRKAHQEEKTIKAAGIELGHFTEKQFDTMINHEDMCFPH